MIQPQFEVLPDGQDDALDRVLEVGRITPVYESLGGSKLASRWIRRTVWNILEELKGIPETLPRVAARIGSAAAGFAEPRAGAARGAFSSGWDSDGAVAGCGDAGASAADLRGAVLPGAGPRGEAAAIPGEDGDRVRDEREGARGAAGDSAVSSDGGAEASAGRDCGRHAARRADAAAAAGRCGIGKDDRGAAGDADRD